MSFLRISNLAALFLLTAVASGATKNYTLSAQYMALAPNAGGQTAYSLRLAVDDQTEYSVFANTALTVGGTPLSGIIYSRRLTLCPRCVVSTFTQVGVGLSLIGPMLEFTWNLTPFWLLRIDFTTHIYFFANRGLTWSYPLWLGVSLPF